MITIYCFQHCEAVCASLQAVDANKDITEYVTKAATGSERPGLSWMLLAAAAVLVAVV